MANGPCILIRAEEHRVLLGFWRGKRLRALEPWIKASGKYELGNLVMTEATPVTPDTVEKTSAATIRLTAETLRRASCRETDCRYVKISGGAVKLKKR